MATTISIIIPVYNTGKYLKQCIESIIHQTFHDIEILIVDDGSENQTAQLCDELATSDSRIRLWHKKNEGVSIARNFAINHAMGDYIGFVDSDDWIQENLCEQALKYIKSYDADIVYFDAITQRIGKQDTADTIINLKESQLLRKSDISPSLLCQLAGSTCRALYKKALIRENKILFPKGIKFSEDRIFNLQAMGKCSKIYYLKQPFYFRLLRNGSAVTSYHPDAIETIIKAHLLIDKILHSCWDDSYKQVYQKQMVGLFYSSMNNIFRPVSNDLSFHQKIKKLKEIVYCPTFQKAIIENHLKDWRSVLSQKHQIYLLSIFSYLINLKHILWKE